jgi:hypothetical protein
MLNGGRRDGGLEWCFVSYIVEGGFYELGF